jgi:hypothetical protein
MALPYPILNAGGAVVVDSSKAAQIAWNAVHANLDRANASMKQKQATTALNYKELNKLSKESSLLDDNDINVKMEETKRWYSDQLSRGANQNSSKFLKEFNTRLGEIESMNGRAMARKETYADNIKMIDGLESGYYKTNEILLELMKNNGLSLSEYNDDLLPELLDSPDYYDSTAKYKDLSDNYRKGLSETVTDYKKGDDMYRSSQLYNPTVHDVQIIDGKEVLVYDITPQEYSYLRSADNGFAKSVDRDVDIEKDRIEDKIDIITTREANGQPISADERLTPAEEKFWMSGGNDRGRQVVSNRLKGMIGTKMSDITTGITEEKKQANRIALAQEQNRLATERAYNKPQSEGDKERVSIQQEQDAVYNAMVNPNTTVGILNAQIPDKETMGGIAKGSFNVNTTDDGLMEITYDTRSVNEYKYKNVVMANTVYLDPTDRGAVLNFVKGLGAKRNWKDQSTKGTANLPVVAPVEKSEVLKDDLADQGYTVKDGIVYDANGKRLGSINEKAKGAKTETTGTTLPPGS